MQAPLTVHAPVVVKRAVAVGALLTVAAEVGAGAGSDVGAAVVGAEVGASIVGEAVGEQAVYEPLASW